MASSLVGCGPPIFAATSKRAGNESTLPISSSASRSPQNPPTPSRSFLPRLRTTKSPPLIISQASWQSSNTKPNSLVCVDCDGNGAILCTKCSGTGINATDHFNGQFKAGQLCWLCRGKREILCGTCNGAGYVGGFMSTFDD